MLSLPFYSIPPVGWRLVVSLVCMGWSMYIRREKGPVSITLPDGRKLTRSDLPPPDTKRWVSRRKAIVLAAVEHGLIDAEEAQIRYQISAEELETWRAAVKQHGAAALRTTALQKYRQPKTRSELRIVSAVEPTSGEGRQL